MDIVITDTVRHVDNDGFILDITDAEIEKILQIPERYEVIEVKAVYVAPVVIPPVVVDVPIAVEVPVIAEAPEIKVAKPVEAKVIPKRNAPVKRGRPSNKR